MSHKPNRKGEMVEWSITVVLKTTVPRGTGGSNPSLSAPSRDNTLIFSELSLLFVFFADKIQTFTVSSLAGYGR